MKALKRIFVALLVCLSASGALAQPADPKLEEAKKAFEAGQVAYNLAQYDVALTQYTKAYQLSKLAPILFNLAQVRRKLFERSHDLKELREARELYQSYLRQVPFGTDTKLAQDLLREVEEEFTRQLHAQRDKLLADTTGPAALLLAEDFLAQNDLSAASTAYERFRLSPGNKGADVARGFRVQARVAAARGDAADAELAWKKAMALDPAIAPPPESDTKSKASYERALAEMKGKRPVAINHVPPGRVTVGQIPRLQFDLSGDSLGIVRELAVYYRAGGGAYSSLRTKPGEPVAFPAVFNASLGPGSKVDYYVEAQDEQRAVLLGLGAEQKPFSFQVMAKKVPVYKRWQFWVGLSAGVVVAAGAATAIGITQAPPSREAIDVMSATPALRGR